MKIIAVTSSDKLPREDTIAAYRISAFEHEAADPHSLSQHHHSRNH